MIYVGIDEAGIGPIAGPMTAAVVALEDGVLLGGVRDSKKMTFRGREVAVDLIFNKSLFYAFAEMSSWDIDALGPSACWDTMLRSLAEMAYEKFPDAEFVVDGNRFIRGCSYVTPIVRADSKILSVSAASVLAKYSQTMWMLDFERDYPGYCFSSHHGYPTKDHLLRLRRLGPCPVHRVTYKPVKKIIESL
jgi:ribonuclease HII